MKKLRYCLNLEQLKFLICHYFGLVSWDLYSDLSLHRLIMGFLEKIFIRAFTLPSFHG